MGYKIAIVFADGPREWNVSQWRALTPSNAMNRHQDEGWSCRLIHISTFFDYKSPICQERLGDADLIIVQRNVIIQEAIDGIKYWIALGKPVLVDLDDAYHILPKSNPAHEFWFQRPHRILNGDEIKGGAILMLFEGLRAANGLTSPNRLLREELAWAAGDTYPLNNYAETDWWTGLPERDQIKKDKGLDGKIVIGWGGSTSHRDGWDGSGIKEAARRITNRHPEVIFLICGSDKFILETLPVSSSQKYSQPYVPPNEWPKMVSMFDIGIAPLWDFYDQHRSDIKTMEYSLAGVPWVATEGVVYESWQGWEAGHLGPERYDFWEDALEHQIKNLKRQQEQARALVPVAQQRCLIDNNLDKWATVVEQAKQNFTDTNAVLPNVMWVRLNENHKNNGEENPAEEPEILREVA